jgi:hypothetical protein
MLESETCPRHVNPNLRGPHVLRVWVVLRSNSASSHPPRRDSPHTGGPLDSMIHPQSPASRGKPPTTAERPGHRVNKPSGSRCRHPYARNRQAAMDARLWCEHPTAVPMAARCREIRREEGGPAWGRQPCGITTMSSVDPATRYYSILRTGAEISVDEHEFCTQNKGHWIFEPPFPPIPGILLHLTLRRIRAGPGHAGPAIPCGDGCSDNGTSRWRRSIRCTG